MYSVADTLAGGFPHSDIFGSKNATVSPKLFAGCHVLHRLLSPRHSPGALNSLKNPYAQTPLSTSNTRDALPNTGKPALVEDTFSRKHTLRLCFCGQSQPRVPTHYGYNGAPVRARHKTLIINLFMMSKNPAGSFSYQHRHCGITSLSRGGAAW